MTDGKQNALTRRSAAGDVTWQALREKGFSSHLDVLAALGRLGLRAPRARAAP